MKEKTLLNVRDEIRQMLGWKEDNMTMEKEHVVAMYVLAYYLKQSFDQVKELQL